MQESKPSSDFVSNNTYNTLYHCLHNMLLFFCQVADVDIKGNIPSTCSPKVQEFIVNFRNIKTTKFRYMYLSMHGAESVGSTFHNEEIPPSVLVELLEALLIFPSNSVADIVAVTRLLNVITGTKRYIRLPIVIII